MVSESHVPHVPPSGNLYVQPTSQPESPRKALESEPKEDLSYHRLPIQKLAEASEYDKNPLQVFAVEISSNARIRQKVEKSKVPCQMVTSEDEPVSIENSHQMILSRGSESQPQHENDEGPTPMIYENDLCRIKKQLRPNARNWRRIAKAEETKGLRETLKASGMKLKWAGLVPFHEIDPNILDSKRRKGKKHVGNKSYVKIEGSYVERSFKDGSVAKATVQPH